MGLKGTAREILYKPYRDRYKRTLNSCLLSYEDYVSKNGVLSQLSAKGMKPDDTPEICLAGFTEVYAADSEMVKKAGPVYAAFRAFLFLHPECDVVYADEFINGKRLAKPDWSPDRYLSEDYLGALIGVRAEFAECLFNGENQNGKIDEASLRDRIVRAAGGFELRDSLKIGHLDEAFDLSFAGKTGPGERTDGAELFSKRPKLSIIIPSKDNYEIIERCLTSIRYECKLNNTEIVVVDNGSAGECRGKVETLLNQLELPTQYVYNPMPFNFATMCNMGANAAEGEVLLFLNDDIVAPSDMSGWLTDMIRLAIRKHVGAVGLKLLYPPETQKGNIIQHAGIQAIPSGPVHRLQYLSDETVHYDHRNRGVHNVIAVTGACLMIRKDVFTEIGGFSESLAVAFNDVDLCYRLWEKGYYNAVYCDKYLYHYESLTRGKDTSEEKLKRLNSEYLKLTQLHYHKITRDPYYPEWLQQSALSTEIALLDKRPDLSDCVQYIEELPKPKEYAEWTEGMSRNSKLRDDACVYGKVLYYNETELHGFSVLLGSDNSTQKKKIILLRTKPGEAEPSEAYTIPITCFFGEMVELKEEEKAKLSSFHIQFKNKIPEGRYIFGVMSENAIGGAGVYHVTDEVLTIGSTSGDINGL